MPKAIRMDERGGPEVLQWLDVEVAAPGAGEALVRHTAVDVNCCWSLRPPAASV